MMLMFVLSNRKGTERMKTLKAYLNVEQETQNDLNKEEQFVAKFKDVDHLEGQGTSIKAAIDELIQKTEESYVLS